MSNSQSSSVRRGLSAGLFATVVLAILLGAKQAAGFMPQLDLVAILARALGFQSLAVGWAAHAVVGILLWGPLFIWVDRKMFFAHWVNGLFFASVVWLGVMLVIMPMAGAGLFGIGLGGVGVPTLTLFLHWVYGVVLGGVYGALQPSGGWPRALGRHWRHHWPHHA